MEAVSGALHIARVKTLMEGAGIEPFYPADGANRGSLSEAISLQGSDAIETESVSSTYLQSQRIVAFDSANYMTRCYDVLRNQLINDDKDRQIHLIAVTAPTSGCGVTVTAVNLALSFARMHGVNVLLVDMNTRPPAIGRLLGLPPVLPDQELTGSLTLIEVNGTRMHVLCPGRHAVAGPGRVDASRLISQITHARQRLMPTVVIYDMPPIVVADELNAVVKEANAAVIVLAAGHSKLSDLEVCKTFLGPRNGIRVVLNKSRKHGL
jgi:Mrp family chromosome partitioning ATPase